MIQSDPLEAPALDRLMAAAAAHPSLTRRAIQTATEKRNAYLACYRSARRMGDPGGAEGYRAGAARWADVIERLRARLADASDDREATDLDHSDEYHDRLRARSPLAGEREAEREETDEMYDTSGE